MFNVGTTSKVSTHQHSMMALIGKLASTPWSCVVFGISNHTDNMSEDSFVGYERSTYVATLVHDVCVFVLIFASLIWL
jgi:hypothetical protein